MGQNRKGRASGEKAYPQRGDIYLAAVDPALGHEINKTRPALVIQNDISNEFGYTTIVAAITSKVSMPPFPNEALIQPGSSGLQVLSTVRLDQIRTVDRKRLLRRLGSAGAVTMTQVDHAIRASLGLIVF